MDSSSSPSGAPPAPPSSSSSSAKEWDELWPIEQILQLDDADVLSTMVSSWYAKGDYRDIVESWSASDLKKVCTKVGLPPLNGSGFTEKMRASINAAIEKHAKDERESHSMEVDSNSSEGEDDHARPSKVSLPPKRTRSQHKSDALRRDRTPEKSSKGPPLPPGDVLAVVAGLPSAPKKSRGGRPAAAKPPEGGQQ